MARPHQAVDMSGTSLIINDVARVQELQASTGHDLIELCEKWKEVMEGWKIDGGTGIGGSGHTSDCKLLWRTTSSITRCSLISSALCLPNQRWRHHCRISGGLPLPLPPSGHLRRVLEVHHSALAERDRQRSRGRTDHFSLASCLRSCGAELPSRSQIARLTAGRTGTIARRSLPSQVFSSLRASDQSSSLRIRTCAQAFHRRRTHPPTTPCDLSFPSLAAPPRSSHHDTQLMSL